MNNKGHPKKTKTHIFINFEASVRHDENNILNSVSQMMWLCYKTVEINLHPVLPALSFGAQWAAPLNLIVGARTHHPVVVQLCHTQIGDTCREK